MSKTENNNYNWYNEVNSLTHNIYKSEVKRVKYFNNKPILSIKQYKALKYRNYLKTLTNDVIRIEFSEIPFQYPKFDQISRLTIFSDNDILEETKTIYDIEIPEPAVIIQESNETLEQNELINRLNYKTQYLYDVVNTYDTYMSLFDDSIKRVILKKVFKLTHSINTRYSEKKLNNWCDNFINMIDDKVRAIKNKKKDAIRSKKSRETYKTSELRYLNIVRKIESLGYYGFDESQIRSSMKSLEDDEIINDMIQEFSEVNSDHDQLERIDEEFLIYNENMAIFKHYNNEDE